MLIGKQTGSEPDIGGSTPSPSARFRSISTLRKEYENMKALYEITGVFDDKVVYDKKEVVREPKSYKRALEHRLRIIHGGEVDLVFKKIANIDTVVTPV